MWLLTENGDLKIPNPLHSYSALFCFIINKVINTILIIVLVFINIIFGPPMSLFEYIGLLYMSYLKNKTVRKYNIIYSIKLI